MERETLSGWRGSPEVWLEAAYELLVSAGVDAVKILPLAQRLGLSRSSFYWHFRDREALLDALLARWQARNTGNLIAQTERYAETLSEAMFHLFDCWVTPQLFDAELDRAVREWARRDPAVAQAVAAADAQRLDAIRAMFERQGVNAALADVRARTVYYTQIGYIAMHVDEPLELRVQRMPDYIETFTGLRPSEAEFARFIDRHPELGAARASS